MALSKTLYPSADAHVVSGNFDDDNFGGDVWLWVGEPDDSSDHNRAVAKFDLSSISSSTVVVTGATLKLYQYDDKSNKTTVLKAHRATESWSEYSVTWKNQPSYNEWFGQVSIGNGHRGDVSISLNKTYVQNWLRGTWANYGFFFFTEEENDDAVGFRSRQWGTTSQRPRLIISYYDVPSVSTTSSSSVKTRKATLTGNITSTNGSTCTVRGFKYGLTQTNTWDSHTSGSYGTGSYSQTITGLKPNTTYYYRAYATNSAGTTYGSWKSFKTKSEGGIFLLNMI